MYRYVAFLKYPDPGNRLTKDAGNQFISTVHGNWRWLLLLMISPWLSETSFGFTFPIATINTNNFMSKFIMGDAEKLASIAIRRSTAKRNKNPTPFVCCMLWNVIGDWYCEHSTNRSAGFSNKRLFYLNFDEMLHFLLLRFNFRSWHIATFLAINVGIVWASGQH